ncbi:MAG: superoxide dismutase [Chitinivibrionales bacterium]|nr:superoxide dismutase [Chitinivibrionales bacterium]
MDHKLPELPFKKDALAPFISAETIDFHYGKHHNAYVTNLNKLIAETEYQSMPLEEIVIKASGPIFNNAAQHWNHSIYWQSLTSVGNKMPNNGMMAAINKNFTSFAKFQEQFTNSALTTFGSGWVWLVKTPDDKLAIESTSNAATPLREGKIPLLTCDVWEHAYYIDYRNNRAAYLTAFWNIVNWNFVQENFE